MVVSSVYLPLSLPRAARRPLARRSRMALRSLSIFSLTITHCVIQGKERTTGLDMGASRETQSQIRVLDIPSTGGCQPGRWCRWSCHAGCARCRQRTSYGRTGSPCQRCCSCSDHAQPMCVCMNGMGTRLVPIWWIDCLHHCTPHVGALNHSPEPHRPCGWECCARCTSVAAPWTAARTSAFGGCATAR